MYITRVRLADFRNYETLDLTGFSPDINVICGSNAQGKTNLLEAIHVCANGKSFRLTQERNFVREAQSSAYLGITYRSDDREHRTEMMIGKDRRKSSRFDGSPLRTIREMIGNLLVVSFSPEDIRTVNEGPHLRRSLLDMEISKIRPSYVDALRQYAQIVQEKNRILKRPDDPQTATLLHVYNEQAVPYISIILRNRRKYVENLNKYVAEVHKEITSGKENVNLTYRAGLREDHILEDLGTLEKREKAAMCSIAGPHRDDLLITLNGRDVRQYASQGQLRSVMLSTKVACVRALKDATDHTPILLLDDVFSELDADRKASLINALRGMQVFITSADTRESPILDRYQQFEVNNGVVVPASKQALPAEIPSY